MIDEYVGSTDETQKKAVADLMAYCGVSVEVDYRDALNGGSSASETGIEFVVSHKRRMKKCN